MRLGLKSIREKIMIHINVFMILSIMSMIWRLRIFQYIVTAVLLGLYLEQRTKFFTTCDISDLENLSLTPNLDRANNSSNTKEVDERVFQFICCLLLRHITQLVCHGHAIYDVGACDTDLDDN